MRVNEEYREEVGSEAILVVADIELAGARTYWESKAEQKVRNVKPVDVANPIQ